MVLAIDIGNTSVKLARIRDGRIVQLVHTPTRSSAPGQRILDDLDDLFGALDPAAGESAEREIVVATVVPGYLEPLRELVAGRDGRLLVAEERTLPLAVRVDQPTEVGADRLVNAFAARTLYGAPTIVVDFGTATTFDVVDAGGAFIGGAIAPGAWLAARALADGTAQLPAVDIPAAAEPLGRDTRSAIQSGVIHGQLGLCRELIGRYRRMLLRDATDGRVRVVLTGGLARAPWLAELEGVDAIEPELTLLGLGLLSAHRRASPPVEVAAR